MVPMTDPPAPATFLDGLRAAREVVERQTDLTDLVHFDRPSDFRKGVLTCLAALDDAIRQPAPAAAATVVVLLDADALREHLDALNESGVTPVAVGVDASPQPFLITLVGPYAESEEVLFDSPWQTDTDRGEQVDGVWVPTPLRCDECRAASYGIEDLRFPVVALTQAPGGSGGA